MNIIDEKDLHKVIRRFYEDLLDDYSWLQSTKIDGLLEVIEITVTENKNLPIWKIKDKVNAAISELKFDNKYIRLKRSYDM